MTIAQMHTWFKLLIDKYQSPYFTDDEIDLFINRAMSNYINENVFLRQATEAGIVVASNAEFSQNWEALVYPLITEPTQYVTNSSGLILFSTIKSALPANTDIIAVLGVTDTNLKNVDFIRHNNLGTFVRNFFTRPSSEYRKFTITASGLKVYPITNGIPLLVTVIRTPQSVNKSTNTDCELPLITHDKILAMAVALAKITTEDEAYNTITSITQ